MTTKTVDNGKVDPAELRRQWQEQQAAAARAYVQAYRAVCQEHGMELLSRPVLTADGRTSSTIDRVKLADGTVLFLQ